VGRYGDGDHGDHHSSAYLTHAAHKKYTTPHQITAYLAYAVADRESNVRYGNENHKFDIFMAYAPHDPRVCQTRRTCLNSGYDIRSFRQYHTGAELGGGQNVARIAKITGSSQNAASQQQVGKAVDDSMAGSPIDSKREWATAGGKAGSWINASWSSPQTISKVVLYDRPNGGDGVTGGKLTFSHGGPVTVGALPGNGMAKVVTFPPRQVTSMRFTVTSVSPATRNVGLAELQVFSPNIATRAKVTASSENTAGNQQAAKAVDGFPTGGPTREWATAGGKAGSWLRLTWRTPQTIDRVVLQDRPNGNDQITGGRLVFSDGSTVAVPALPNNGAARTITFPRRTVTNLQLNVTSVSATTRNAGLAEVQVEPPR
jgi:hypothetical protein